MAIVGVQSVDDMVVVTFSRSGVPISDLLFVPDAQNCVITAVEDLLHDGSQVAFFMRVHPATAKRLAQLLSEEAEKLNAR